MDQHVCHAVALGGNPDTPLKNEAGFTAICWELEDSRQPDDFDSWIRWEQRLSGRLLYKRGSHARQSFRISMK
jgi:hypothetical protein